ncbi:MAG: shikimate dehydrogenase [Clostridia bacterium]|nr:shikimate dehydrogenase [Clostridia bacterium]
MSSFVPLHPASGRGRRFAVVGWPVAHSLSPRLHNAAFRAVRSPHLYEAVAVPADGFAAFAATVRSDAMSWGGFNVTIPHKTAAALAADELRPAAAALGAANAVAVGPGGRLVADNTDAAAALHVLRERRDPAPGGTALVLGAGGAARAAVWALARWGAGRVVVAARDVEKARALLTDVRGALEPGATELAAVALAPETLHGALRDARVIVNATPVGLADPDASPLEDGAWEIVRPGGLCFDMVYGPRRTRLLRQAALAGWDAVDGIDMLVRQASLSWELWFGGPAPESAMRAALSDIQ